MGAVISLGLELRLHAVCAEYVACLRVAPLLVGN
jgi:hypothetical protein